MRANEKNILLTFFRTYIKNFFWRTRPNTISHRKQPFRRCRTADPPGLMFLLNPHFLTRSSLAFFLTFILLLRGFSFYRCLSSPSVFVSHNGYNPPFRIFYRSFQLPSKSRGRFHPPIPREFTVSTAWKAPFSFLLSYSHFFVFLDILLLSSKRTTFHVPYTLPHCFSF